MTLITDTDTFSGRKLVEGEVKKGSIFRIYDFCSNIY